MLLHPEQILFLTRSKQQQQQIRVCMYIHIYCESHPVPVNCELEGI